MRRAGRTLGVAGLLVILAGCFNDPVAPPVDVALDEGLLGHWRCGPAEANSSEHADLGVWRFDEHQYYAEWREDDDVSRFRAYLSEADGVQFLSVADLSAVLAPWTAVRYSSPEPGVLDLRLPAQRILDMDDSRTAARVLASHASRSDSWQFLARCRRE